MPFQELVGEATGQVVPMFQRVDQAGYRLPLDERVLGDADTLLVFGLDLLRTEQEAAQEEIEALEHFLAREGTCLVVGPHHDVGRSDDLGGARGGVPPPRRPAGAAAAALRPLHPLAAAGLGVPVDNRWGLHPASDAAGAPAPLAIARDLDTRGWLAGVTSFNLHPHLPHYAVTDDASPIRVLARQPIDMTRPPHPYTEAGNRAFNAFLWLPPSGARAGDVLLADSTLFSTLFGVTDSLKQLWLNIAR